jgi:hypothetical protein
MASGFSALMKKDKKFRDAMFFRDMPPEDQENINDLLQQFGQKYEGDNKF